MSSSSVCQGLQSCLESRLMEPRVLKLKLTPSKSKFSGSISPNPESQSHVEEYTTIIEETDNKNDDRDMKKSEKTEEIISGWSFLQCLTTNTTTKERDDDGGDGNEKVYIHPLDKRSSSVLSEKSLEMCTESLGSETGSSLVSESSDDGEDDDDDDDDGDTLITTISSPEITNGSGIIKNYNSTKTQELRTKRNSRSSVSFPPPLTSSSGVQVMRPHREGGRLVLQAVTVSSSPTYFHVERSDGRLRLCLVKHLNPSPPKEEEEEEEEEEFDEEDEDYCCDDSNEDMEDKKGEVRDEIGMEKLAMGAGSGGSCKEEGGVREAGNKLIWEPFWVAT